MFQRKQGLSYSQLGALKLLFIPWVGKVHFCRFDNWLLCMDFYNENRVSEPEPSFCCLSQSRFIFVTIGGAVPNLAVNETRNHPNGSSKTIYVDYSAGVKDLAERQNYRQKERGKRPFTCVPHLKPWQKLVIFIFAVIRLDS